MRHPIETVPKHGKSVILEDDINGTYELARWSAQEGGAGGSPLNHTELDLPLRYLPGHALIDESPKPERTLK